MPSIPDSTGQVVDTSIRLGLIALIGLVCFQIFQPFLLPVAWGAIIAVAIHPLHLRVESALGGRSRLAVVVFALLALALLIVPTAMLTATLFEEMEMLAAAYEKGTLQVPPPPASIADWPLVGERLHAAWEAANQNLAAFLERYASQLASIGKALLGAAAGTGATVLQFVVSVVIAAVFLANAEGAGSFARRLATRLAGAAGNDFVDLSAATTRSVSQGVLGVAVIQAILAGVGMLAVGVPAAGFWSLLVLVLAIVQLPPLIVLAPVIAYVFSAHDTVPAVLFAVWGAFVSVSDSFLKPLLLGRGLDAPMLVVLVGAIGGMILAGVIGLFVGSVVLVLGYKLLVAWLEDDVPPVAADPESGA